MLCALLLGFAFIASAQEATIAGSITGQTGLAIPSATITLLNTETGQNQVPSSNEAELFRSPQGSLFSPNISDASRKEPLTLAHTFVKADV